MSIFAKIKIRESKIEQYILLQISTFGHFEGGKSNENELIIDTCQDENSNEPLNYSRVVNISL